MKIKMFLLSFCISQFLFGNIKVEFTGNLASEEIIVQAINEIEYAKINELNKVFHAVITEDTIDQRLSVNMYGEQIIFLLESSYVQFRDEIFNMKYPILCKNGVYYIPKLFITRLLPKFFDDKITAKKDKLIANVPVDSSIKRIVIDPGHGGKDPGAVSYTKKNYEKNIVLKIAEKLKNILEKNLDVTVLLTRSKDEFVSLQDRTKYANQENADLFISLHCNAHRKKNVNGVEVYYLSTAKTDEARAVEALENSVVYEFEGGNEAVQQYNDLSFILADMAQNEHLKESNDLAVDLQKNLVSATNMKDRGVKQANFYVLRGAFMPAVLIELGFLSNKQEENQLSNGKHQDKLASAIFDGIKKFKNKYDNMQ